MDTPQDTCPVHAFDLRDNGGPGRCRLGHRRKPHEDRRRGCSGKQARAHELPPPAGARAGSGAALVDEHAFHARFALRWRLVTHTADAQQARQRVVELGVGQPIVAPGVVSSDHTASRPRAP